MKINKLQLFWVIFTLVCPTTLLAISSLPSIPLLVYGSVTIDGKPAPLDTEISAEIDNVEVAVATIIEDIYFIKIPDGKANEGKTMIFKVNGIIDDNNQLQCVNIDTTPVLNFNLTITTQMPSNETTDTSGSTGGGGGGGGYTYVPPVLTSELSEAAQAVDTNNDDKIDILDFNTLMVNWGSTAVGNLADFDNNNKVDIFDFNLLMIHWVNL